MFKMDTKTKNFKTRLIAVITVALLALSLILPFIYANKTVNVSANTSEIYYFSDNEDSNKYAQFIRDNTTRKLTLYNLIKFNDANTLNNYLNDIKIDGNSHVILELRETEIDSSFDTALKNWFSGLKYNKCKTMFICDTSEERFVTGTSFLNYVDIHVNTDTFLPFFDNAMRRIEQKEPSDTSAVEGTEMIELNNRKIIFDKNLSKGFDNINSFMKELVLPYLIENFRIDIYSDYSAIMTTCIERNVHLYFSTDSDYVDITTDEHFHIDEICEDAYAMGSVGDIYDLHRWLNDIINYEIPLFQYDGVGADLSGYEFTNKLYYCGDSAFFERAEFSTGEDRDNYRFTMADILIDFIYDGDLTVYDNWEGVCAVTSKPLFPGKDGWIDGTRALDCYQKNQM